MARTGRRLQLGVVLIGQCLRRSQPQIPGCLVLARLLLSVSTCIQDFPEVQHDRCQYDEVEHCFAGVSNTAIQKRWGSMAPFPSEMALHDIARHESMVGHRSFLGTITHHTIYVEPENKAPPP